MNLRLGKLIEFKSTIILLTPTEAERESSFGILKLDLFKRFLFPFLVLLQKDNR